MNGPDVRRLRQARGLTQAQLASGITATLGGNDTVSQSFISQIEREARPIPRKEREFVQDVTEPSIYDELVSILKEASAEELRELLDAPGSRYRGPYRRELKSY